ncbi:MAG: glucoamylase family protein [Bacteroidota bacterium]
MKNYLIILLIFFLFSCKKDTDPIVETFTVNSTKINDEAGIRYNINYTPSIKVSFTAPVNKSSVASGIIINETGVGVIPVNYSYQNNDSIVLVQPSTTLKPLTKYTVSINMALKTQNNTTLQYATSTEFITQIDSTNKFPLLTDNQLLDTVQRRTFRFFWEFGHPVSGMARERNTSGDLVTTGGTGFGIMAIIAAIERGFITKNEGKERILKITNFLINNCTRYHGAFAHWVNGATGATLPFSANDNGADLVETSYLMNGLITARQYFNTVDPIEVELRTKINLLWNGVEWNWFRQNDQNVLYWHWSADKNWIINAQIKGWNEALITYILATSSTTYTIPKTVYDNGWASNGGMKNGNIFFNYVLPLGPSNGGPLFFEHYSFLGVNPDGLQDIYANYKTQTTNHTLINYEYCKANPRGYYGYSADCWGLTASDVPNGYNASEPNNDVGVIAPTAALSSMPYTPVESMRALKFFYYKLGDKIWGEYGFKDAFKLQDLWFANSYLAIDQGPIIVMIENYRSGLLWDLFTSAPEIKAGMTKLGFTAPYL